MKPSLLGAIRRATLDDIPFFEALAREKYGDRFHDPDKAEKLHEWLANLFQRGDYTCLKGDFTAGIARVQRRYGCELKGQLVALAARPGCVLEPLQMIKVMLLWAKAVGATGTFTLDADTGHDFEPFARRLKGEKIVKTSYEIPLE